MKQTARINNWWIGKTQSGKRCLCGHISEHPDRFANSWSSWDISVTSELLSIDEEKGTAETRNTIYSLGKKRQEAA